MPGTPLFYEDRKGSASNAVPKWNLVEETNNASSGDAGNPAEARGARKRPRNNTDAVWVDDEDENFQVDIASIAMRRKLRKSHLEKAISASEYQQRIRTYFANGAGGFSRGPGEWAQCPSSKKEVREEDKSGQSSDEESSETNNNSSAFSSEVQKLLKSSGRALQGGSSAGHTDKLQRGILDIRRLKDANREDPCRCVIEALEFHPSGRLLLTAGIDKTLRIFQVDGKTNSKVQGIHLEHFPIYTAHFANAGDTVVITGKRRFFYRFDMASGKVHKVHTLAKKEHDAGQRFVTSTDGSTLAFLGKGGLVTLVSAKSMQEIGHLYGNGHVSSAAFAPSSTDNEYCSSHELYTASVDGTVYLWDTRRMQCVTRHKDEGAVHSTCIDASSSHYAVGSDSGIVNVYTRDTNHDDTRGVLYTPSPKKSFSNLTTTINGVAFNPDGDILAMCSSTVKDSLRLVHIPSMRVFSNWPSMKTPLARVTAVAFSPGGGYLAVGNHKGNAQLYRIHAYPAN